MTDFVDESFHRWWHDPDSLAAEDESDDAVLFLTLADQQTDLIDNTHLREAFTVVGRVLQCIQVSEGGPADPGRAED